MATDFPKQRCESFRRFGAVVLALALLEVQRCRAFVVPGPNGDITSFIFGGANADVERYPYMVSFRAPGTGRHFCGGALVSPNLALSAAHCIDPRTGGIPNPVLHVGRYCTTEPCPLTDEFVVATVQRVVPHFLWDGTISGGADVALIVLNERLDGHPVLNILPQPNPAAFPEGKELFVVGWGATNGFMDLPRILQEADLPFHGNAICREMYENDNFGDVIKPGMICAGGKGKETCQGDSGGPLIIRGRDWKADLGVGVVSFGNSRCGDPDGVPGVFTSLYEYETDLARILGTVTPIRPAGVTQPKAPERGYCSLQKSCSVLPPDEPGFCDENQKNCEDSCRGLYCPFPPVPPTRAPPRQQKSTPAPTMQPTPAPTSLPLPELPGEICQNEYMSRHSTFDSNGSLRENCQELCLADQNCAAYIYVEKRSLCVLYDRCAQAKGNPDATLVYVSAPLPAQTTRPTQAAAARPTSAPATAQTTRPTQAAAARPTSGPAPEPRTDFPGETCSNDYASRYSEFDLNDFGDDFRSICLELCRKDKNCVASVFNGKERFMCMLFNRCDRAGGVKDATLVYKSSAGLAQDGSDPDVPGGGAASRITVGDFSAAQGKTCDMRDRIERWSKFDLNDLYSEDEFGEGCHEMCERSSDCKAYVYNPAEHFLCIHFDRCSVLGAKPSSMLFQRHEG